VPVQYWRVQAASCGCHAWYRAPRQTPRARSFFFSSRSRHTRSLRDWSSDVCSSDLPTRVRIEVLDRTGQVLDAHARRVELAARPDRKSVVEGKSGELGGGRRRAKAVGERLCQVEDTAALRD